MNNRNRLYLILFLIAFLGVWIVFSLRGKPRRVNHEPSQETNNSGEISLRRAEAPLIDQVQRTIEIKRDLKLLNTQPIDYFGLTVDETGAALPGVQIRFDINVGSGEKPIAGTITSGPDGRFAITGYQGMQLWIRPHKEGYRDASTNSGGKFSLLYSSERYSGNVSNPSILRMWKLRGAEDLIIINQEYPFSEESTASLVIDLLKGKTVETGGDLRITVSRTNFDERGNFDWTYVVEPIDGGIMAVSRSDVSTLLEAPVEGYQLRIEKEFSELRSKRLPNDDQPVFLLSRGGRVYSKFILGVAPPQSNYPGRVFLRKGVANPNSSRNWQEDPQKMRLPQ